MKAATCPNRAAWKFGEIGMRPPDQSKGGVLIFALLVIVIGAFVLAAWAQTLSGRIHSIEAAAASQKRRIALGNARMLAQQYILEGMANGTVANSSSQLASNWGRFSLSFTATNTLTSTNQAVKLNYFSPFGAGGYVATPLVVGNGLVVTLEGGDPTNGGETLNRSFYIRSRSPLTGGYPISLHTNSGATNFSTLIAGTNEAGGSALVFASPSTISNAPAATNYLAPSWRRVRLSSSGTSNAPALGIGFSPATSGSSGYGGQLDSPLARTARIADVSEKISTVLSNTPAVSDTSSGEYRYIGPPPSGMKLEELPLSSVNTTHGSSKLLYFGPANATISGNSTTTVSYAGTNFKFRLSSGNVQYTKNSRWTTMDASSRMALLASNGTLSNATIDTGGSAAFSVGSVNRALVFSPPRGSLVVFAQDALYFQPISTTKEGALVFRTSEYFKPNGIAFVAIPGIPPAGSIWTVDETVLSKFDPPIMNTQYRCQFSSYNFRVFELDIGSTYTISDTDGEAIIGINPDATTPFSLIAGASSGGALLHHLDRVAITAGGSSATVYFRRWLSILNADLDLNLTSASSSLLFAVFDNNALSLSLENADNERDVGLVVSGEEPNTTTLSCPSGETWNLAATFANSPATLSAGGNFTIVGGIRANRNVTTSGNPVQLFPNASPSALDPFLDRLGWLESWEQ